MTFDAIVGEAHYDPPFKTYAYVPGGLAERVANEAYLTSVLAGGIPADLQEPSSDSSLYREAQLEVVLPCLEKVSCTRAVLQVTGGMYKVHGSGAGLLQVGLVISWVQAVLSRFRSCKPRHAELQAKSVIIFYIIRDKNKKSVPCGTI